MPPRKAHQKSRRGCLECKRRHTKCDEQHLQCSTCKRLQIDCTWPVWKPGGGSRAPSSGVEEGGAPDLIANFNNISKSLTGRSALSSEDLAIDDLRLLHHFTTKTYATLDSHPFLLRGVLALAALHLATLTPDSSKIFLIQASNQYNHALIDFRKALNNVSEENCGAVFAFSCITVCHAFAVAQIHPPEDPIADFLNCLRLVPGVLTVLQPHYSVLLGGELGPIVQNGLKGSCDGQIPEIQRLKLLVKSQLDNHSCIGEATEPYMHAIDHLETVLSGYHKATEDQSYLAVLLSWPVPLSPQFFSLLSAQEPVALVIMSHFAAFLGHEKKIWWISGWNKYIVNEVEAQLTTDLHEWLAWPKHTCETMAC